ncbi:hypothetical protein DL98DRAFT_605295 [Cadophora sp. DSE1049]|nr:hypothetical protein DL98DRAFT_605295 [Cadophora sp. DSE1049]
MEVPASEAKTRVYVHLIRHAQAQHNYDTQTVTASQKALKKAIRDPLLTPHGENEALDLLYRFPHHQKLTHIITSPLRRTLQTTILALEPAIRSGIRPIAVVELREVGNGPNSTGSEITLALRDLGELGGSVRTDTLDPGWEWNLEQRYMTDERAQKVNRMLKDLGDLASGRTIDPDSKSGMKELWDFYGLQPVEVGREVHIAVVSHGAFLWKMTGEELGDHFGNGEFRMYRFREEEDGLKENEKSWDLVEVQESLDRPHPSTNEEDLAKRAMEREQANGADMKNAGAGVSVVEHVEDARSPLETAVMDPRLFL